eukprot:Plantae.Rhodophyta-Purpureofilum_apyrenoidigerum.ctg3684.p1 GENE.Plantae.Rhodophyta-Purpureofilum_apyrenoidigerum.ctg3684~~Plantae.Rhodophyta-Purpureofilum_apyrenoidigerum.ctg3684.p1  ORF type:complete len:367 (-),score=70.12 Plantae.Rhodophyta-Purpureofilum_apyrenoidigerum.ctg3684:1587-2666(-)
MAFVTGAQVFGTGRLGVAVRDVCRRPVATRARRRSALGMVDDFDDIAKQMAQELNLEQDKGPPAMAGPGSDAPPPEVQTGEGGMKTVVLEHKPTNQKVTIYTFGATLQSWMIGQKECFFTSDEAQFNGAKAIRAGIPICFPQFGPYGDLPTHGFARITEWDVKSLETLDDGSAYAVLGISSSTDSDLIRKWSEGKSWEAEYAVTLSASGIETALRVKNTGSSPIEFTAAFHNYFVATDISAVRVFGLDKTTYKDRLDSDKVKDSPDDLGQGVSITEETDRIYTDVTQDIAVFDMTSLRLMKIRKTETLCDSTLWNPYGAKGADPGYKEFVCVEPAVISKPAVVAPGEEWVGAQLLNVDL